jgi:hypothetical protein
MGSPPLNQVLSICYGVEHWSKTFRSYKRLKRARDDDTPLAITTSPPFQQPPKVQTLIIVK